MLTERGKNRLILTRGLNVPFERHTIVIRYILKIESLIIIVSLKAGRVFEQTGYSNKSSFSGNLIHLFADAISAIDVFSVRKALGILNQKSKSLLSVIDQYVQYEKAGISVISDKDKCE